MSKESVCKESVYKKLLVELLHCAELNQENLETETLELIDQVNITLMTDDLEEDEFDAYDDESEDVYDN